MKTLLARLLIITLVCTIYAASLVAWAQAPTTAQPETTTREIVLSVPDMECPLCFKSVKGEIRSLQGVHEIHVDEFSRTATVRYDPNVVNAQKMQRALKKAGFISRPVRSVDAAAPSSTKP